jgi:hypothetical protein
MFLACCRRLAPAATRSVFDQTTMAEVGLLVVLKRSFSCGSYDFILFISSFVYASGFDSDC